VIRLNHSGGCPLARTPIEVVPAGGICSPRCSNSWSTALRPGGRLNKGTRVDEERWGNTLTGWEGNWSVVVIRDILVHFLIFAVCRRGTKEINGKVWAYRNLVLGDSEC